MTHRECVKVPLSCGDALEWPGHGEVLLGGAFGQSWERRAQLEASRG